MSCANYLCGLYGCQRTPSCHRHVGFPALTPKGCVCPPRSEETCQRRDCGRRDAFGASAPKASAHDLNGAWRPITEAPRDGTNVWLKPDRPREWGADEMYGHWSWEDGTSPTERWWIDLDGSRQGFDGAWSDAEFTGWRPAERTASPVAVDDRTQAASEASEPPPRDGADKPVEGEGGRSPSP